MNKKSNLNKIKFGIFISIIFIALIIIILNAHKFEGKLSIHKIVDIMRSRGELSSLIYLAVFAIKPIFVIIPTNIIAVASGIVFGSFKGFILTMIGYFISGTVAFYLSRFLGRDFIEELVGNRFIKLDNNLETSGFKILFLLRLPPILPYDALSYACGLTKISYRDFILASVIGVIPETICYCIIGPNIRTPFSLKFILPIIILLLGLAFAKKIIIKINKNPSAKK